MSTDGSHVSVRNRDGMRPAGTFRQEPVTAAGVPALDVACDDSTATVIFGKGGGTLLDLWNTSSVSKFKVDNSGNATAAGTLSVTGGITAGTKAYRYLDMEPSGTLGSTIPRGLASASSASLTTGTVYCCAIGLDKGVVVTNISVYVTSTAETTGTHAWIGLADASRNVLAVSADKTGATYFGGTQTAVTTAMASPYTTTAAGMYYVFIMVAASGSTPLLAAAPALANSALSNVAPIACGTADTSQTTPPTAGTTQLATITATAGHLFYAWIT